MRLIVGLLHSSCCKICLEPFTTTPIGLPCGCVFPTKIRLLLQASVYAVFPFMNELEIEIAAGTYLTQNQVVITGASSDGEDHERMALDVNLVPLGEGFDNLTAALTYERFWHKKLSLNKTLFGDYEVVYIIYPGLPTAPNYSNIRPSESPRSQDFSITDNFTHTSQKMNHKTIFVIAFLAIVFVIVCCGAISVILKYRMIYSSLNAVGPDFTPSTNNKRGLGALLSSDKASSTPISVVSTMPTSCLSVKKFALAELEKATDKFSSKKVLGVGGFRCVYHGIMEDGVDVAVKLLYRDDNQYGDCEFIAEVEILSRLHHLNLVQLIGICMEGHTRCMVYELVPNGSIESHLHGVDRQKGPLDWDARLNIALGAARGLAYLHEDSNPSVIHRDFKAGNVLLEDDFTPKISDFGLAREATEGSRHISIRIMGTFGYVAPEYAMTGHLPVKSDVYSYGVVLLELLTGRKPVDTSQPPGKESLVTWARPLLTIQEGLRHLVDPNLAGTYDSNDMAKVAAIASMCVNLEVTQRPFMGEVVQALKVICYKDETTTQRDSSAVESESKGDGSWWNADGEASQRLIYGNDSSHFITMEYSSSSNGVARESVIDGLANRSGPRESYIK